MMKKMLFGLLLMAAVFAQGMNFTGFNNYKLSTAPGAGVNPPSGNISIWWTVTDSTLTMHWRDSAGADHTFSSGATYTAGTGISITDGVISASGGSYSLPTASDSVKGGVKIGSGLTMTGEVLSVSGGGSSTPTALGTSGDQTVTSGNYTLTPVSSVTLHANLTNMQESLVDITNGNGKIIFPSTWNWLTPIPALQTKGVDRIKLTAMTLNSVVVINAELVYNIVDYTDPDSAYLVLFMPFNGGNNSISFTDITGRHNSDITINGTAAISTAAQYSGNGSLYVAGSGNGIDVNLGSDSTFGTGSFTIEWLEKATSSGQGAVVMQLGGWAIWALQYSGGTTYIQTGSCSGGTTTSWVLSRMVRDGSGNCKYWRGGTLQYEWTNSYNFNDTYTLYIGGYASPGGTFNGYIQNVKVYKGLAKTNGN